MIIKVLIIDDEKLARELIRSIIVEMRDIEIIGEASNGEEAVKAIRKYRPDLIFLDIQMPGMSGFNVLERIDPVMMPYVIFITAYDRYAIKAFEIHALDYILKPFEKERFLGSVHRAKEIIHQKSLSGLTNKILQLVKSYAKEDSYQISESGNAIHSFLQQIIVRDGKRVLTVNVKDITWLEAANQYVKIHTQTRCHLISNSLRNLQDQLDPRSFLRIHRSSIVNGEFIKEIRTMKHGNYAILLSTGEYLKLSRSRRRLLKVLLQYCT